MSDANMPRDEHAADAPAAGEPHATGKHKDQKDHKGKAGQSTEHVDQLPKLITLPAEEHQRLVDQAKQAEEMRDQHLRALADFDNSRKRLERDRDEFAKFASERLIKQLLPILDSFEQAVRTMEGCATHASMLVGVQLILKQLTELLQKEGVERIKALGQPFDHHRHEAVLHVEAADATDNTVIEEVQAGYLMHGKVLRPALVKVAKAPAAPEQQTTPKNA